MFSIEIEYLNRVSFAARHDKKNQAEWPPHPDRVFLAFVAAWGQSGKDSEESNALRWLEAQNPPDILFPDTNLRDSFTNFVPTSSNSENLPKYLKNIPIYEMENSIARKERAFPAVILPNDQCCIHLVWNNTSIPEKTYGSLQNIANRISWLGHPASLVRVVLKSNTNYAWENKYVCDDDGMISMRCPYKGRFDNVSQEYESHSSTGGRFVWRPNAAPTCQYHEFVPEDIPNNMGGDWIILSCVKGDINPPLESFPIIAKKLRNAIMSHIDDPIHEVISGHGRNKGVLQKPHMAIIPMANVGWKEYSDGRLVGIALVLPSRSSYGTDERIQLKRSVFRFLNSDHDKSDRDDVGTLYLSEHAVIKLKKSNEDKMSLQSQRYTTKSSVWDTVTPIVLDKHPKKNKSAETIISDSCENVGLPRPERVKISRYSQVAGAPAAFVSKSNRGWKSPKAGMLDNKFICHAVLEFKYKIRGPLLLGSGRYYGLGLCMSGEP